MVPVTAVIVAPDTLFPELEKPLMVSGVKMVGPVPVKDE